VVLASKEKFFFKMVTDARKEKNPLLRGFLFCFPLLNFILFPEQRLPEYSEQCLKGGKKILAVNVHNIPHYIHVISEHCWNDAVSNLYDRLR